MPLTAVWMELITGAAIGDGRHGGRGGEGAETARGGGARECAYCRGREVVGEGERAVWLDFSNAAVADAGGAAWETRAEAEMDTLRWVVGWSQVLTRGGGCGLIGTATATATSRLSHAPQYEPHVHPCTLIRRSCRPLRQKNPIALPSDVIRPLIRPAGAAS